MFAGLPECDLEFCAASFGTLRTSPGELVFTPLQGGGALFVVRRGAVRLYRLIADGRKVVLADLDPGDVFGWSRLFGPQSTRTFAEARCDTDLYTIGEPVLRELLGRHPDVILRLLRVLGRRLQAAEDLVDDLQCRTAEQRVVREIVRLAHAAGDGRLGITHDEIASHALVVRETVTKVVGALERDGLVRAGYRFLAVLDLQRLADRGGE